MLFGNLDEVASLSRELLSALEEGQPLVGGVFVTFAPRLRDTYGMYCRNHDVAASILEKVCVHNYYRYRIADIFRRYKNSRKDR